MANSLDDSIDAYKDTFDYSLDNQLILNWYPQRVMEKMKSGSLLELGVGHGFTIQNFAKQVTEYTILEGSQKVIDEFNKNYDIPNIQIEKVFFEDYQTEKKFSNIVMGFVLEHVDDPKLIIEKYREHLELDGKLFIAVPNAESLHRRVGYEAGLLNDVCDLSDSDRLLGHKRYFKVKDMTKTVEDAGMKVCSVEGLFLKPLMTSQLKQLGLSSDILKAFMKIGVNYPELSTALLFECTNG